MVKARYERLQQLFGQALAVPPDSRTQFLDSHCDDDGLRRELDALLQAHEHESDYLEPGEGSQAFGHLQSAWSPETPVPTQVGRYRIIGIAGRGGMGTVYEAEQDLPRRRVALKLIRHVGVSRELVRRFERESDILARLKHPNIAQVHDAGSAEVTYEGDVSGGTAPYFALELIDGSPIDRYVSDHDLPVAARLELFARICDAVHYAHQNGVIHRDLKPKNILVDDRGEPKIVDFGIARATDATDGTVQTEVGQLVGTLPYMSPEQVSGDPTAVDARSDIYSLGVVLYELLAGSLPYDVSSSSVPEVTRIIVDTEPKRLGTIDRDYRGDLETIADRALQKQPEARYASAAALGADVERHLRQEPIEARRDSVLYLAHRRLRRYRGVLGLGLVALILLGSLGTYAWMQALNYNQLAIQESNAKQDALESEKKAADARQEAIQQRDEARAATAFLMDVVGMADPDITQQMDSSRLTMLRDVASEIDERFRGQPDAEAMIRTGLGRVFFANGYLHEAETELRTAHMIRRSDEATTPQQAFDVLWPYSQVLWDVDDGTPHHHVREAWWALGDIMAERSPDVYAHVCKYWEFHEIDMDAVRQLVEESSKLGRTVPELFADRCYLSGMMRPHNKTELALPWLEEALGYYLELYPETNTRVARCRGALTDALLRLEEYEEALQLANAARDAVTQFVPSNHWYLAMCTARRGAALAGLGQHADAEGALLEGLRGVCESLGEDVRMATTIRWHLLDLYEQTGRDSDAHNMRRALARSMVVRRQETFAFADALRLFGPEDTDLTEALKAVHGVQTAPAESLQGPLDTLLLMRRSRYADDHVLSGVVANILNHWANNRANTRFDDQILPFLEEAARIGHAIEVRYPRHLAKTYLMLGWYYDYAKDYVAAEEALLKGLEIVEPLPHVLYGFRGILRSTLGRMLEQQRRFEEAHEQLTRGLEHTLTILGPENVNTYNAIEALVSFYMNRGQVADATTAVVDYSRTAIRMGRRPRWMLRTCWLALRRPGLEPAAYEAGREVVVHFGAQDNDPHLGAMLAMFEHRIGRHREAIRLSHETLESLPEVTERIVHARAILALAHHSLGEDVEAKEWQRRLGEWTGRSRGVLGQLMGEVKRTLGEEELLDD